MNKQEIKDKLHALEVEVYMDNVALDGLTQTVKHLFSDICNTEINVMEATLIDSGDDVDIKATLQNGLIVFFEDVKPNEGYCTFTLRVFDK